MAGTITHQWNGTILTITSDSGTSAMDLKGAKGDDGARGAMGLPGDANLIEAVDKAEKAAADAETALSQLGTARNEAVAAAAQVKAIVAGNEAFTKAESDSRFANAIKPTATGEVATANDSGNYPLQGLSIYGKTTQAGTPTPTSPIDLVNCGVGSIGVNVSGKNLLNYDAWKTVTIQHGTAVWENNGVTLTATADDCYTGDGLGWAENGMVFPAKIYVEPGETITLSWEADRSYDAPVYIFPNAKIEGLVACNNKDNTPLIYTVAEGVKYITIRFTALKAGETIAYKNIMVERGGVATAYEPYKNGGSITLNTPNGLPGIPVSSGGNYTDSTGQQWIADEIDLAKGVYKHWVMAKTYNGSENITYNGDAFNVANAIPAGEAAYKKGYCSHYVVAQNYSDFINNPYTLCNWNNGALRIRHNGSTDVAAFKSWLSANPITLYQPLATPTETALTAAEIAAYKALQSQYPNTTVYSDANAGIAATYVADTKLYIDNKFNELSTALVAMGG